ncbi:hypothetical protein [Oceanirhabdus seepicola]|uniref:Uncharacterized protein n=1 Tax=Oceanirhabdus seepicola TaxID=2828781 RepID=A0A9J6NW82_9CLOT|nr:hypothetical protein [Oceanirhabdus seepicola]MCM1988762.1 hypothetical protein [Oceanirhabdus seepicola]
MEKVAAMHTLVRKYCIEEIEDLKDKLNECYKINSEIIKEIGEKEFIESKDPKLVKLVSETIKARCLEDTINYILIGIEEIIPEDYKSVEELNTKIIKTIESNEIKSKYFKFNRNYTREEEKGIIKILKNQLINYIETVVENQLNSVEPMFHRRTLKLEEIDNIEERIDVKWEIGHFCDPFTGSGREDIIVFNQDFFYDEIRFNKVKEALKKIGEERIYEIRIGCGVSCVMDTSVFTIFNHHYCCCSEGFWCSEKMDWIIYKSHEGTIAIGGEKLLEEVKENIESWKEGVFSFPV